MNPFAMPRTIGVTLVAAVLTALDLGADPPASEPEPFPPRIERSIGGRKVKLVRTGKAPRKQLNFTVYHVASYVHEGATVKTAEELAALNRPKQLLLDFVVTVPGDEMARALESVLRRNYPAPAFAKELDQLLGQVRKTTTRKGDRILMTHIPDKGLLYRFQGKDSAEELLIPNPNFSKAIWDNYLGEHNCGETVKLGLVSEL